MEHDSETRQTHDDGDAYDSASPLKEQYSLRKILGIWAAVSLPMLLSYSPLPSWISDATGMSEPIAVFSVITLGLVWMFIVGVLVLLRELPNPTEASIKERLRLTKPVNPRSGKASNVYLWWGLAASVAVLGIGELVFPIQDFMLSFLPDGLINDRADLFDTIEVGDYWVIALFLFAAIFNYFLGEEFIFRGILLPKMEGVFGRATVLANGVLFAMYHLHIMYAIPSLLLVTWIYAFVAFYFRSTWVAVVGHGVEGVLVLTLVTLGVLGVGA